MQMEITGVYRGNNKKSVKKEMDCLLDNRRYENNRIFKLKRRKNILN